MHLDYDDIKDRIPDPPIWYDENGVPRYCPFEPRETGIYVNFAIYVRIACQSCDQEFLVGAGRDKFVIARGRVEPYEYSLELLTNYHYGDPPAHGCVGDTMNCIDLEIIEAWSRDGGQREWTRFPEYEGLME